MPDRTMNEIIQQREESAREHALRWFEKKLAEELSDFNFDRISVQEDVVSETIKIIVHAGERSYMVTVSRQMIENIVPNSLFPLIVDNFRSQLAGEKKNISIDVNVKLGSG